MAITNHEHVGKAMDLLKQGLAPFVEREFTNSYKDKAGAEAIRYLGEGRPLAEKDIVKWDAARLLKLMWEAWNDVFRRTLGQAERSLVSELRDFRNKWAHQQTFSADDAYRALDSAGRLLTAISAPQADEIEETKMELRLRWDEQGRSERRKGAGTPIESEAAANLDLGREVATPHKDAASELSRCDWVYFATPAKWSGTVTRDFVAKHKIIVRNIFNKHHPPELIANVQHLMPGERILLVYGGHGKPYRALLSATIAEAPVPVCTPQRCFEVFSCIDESLNERLKEGGYDRDPVVRAFTGISITSVDFLPDTVIPRPSGIGTIRRRKDVVPLLMNAPRDSHGRLCNDMGRG